MTIEFQCTKYESPINEELSQNLLAQYTRFMVPNFIPLQGKVILKEPIRKEENNE